MTSSDTPVTLPSFDGPVALNVKVVVKSERRDEFLDVIGRDAVQTIASEPGSIQFTFGEDVETPNMFYLHEQYKTESDFDFHRTTAHFAAWMKFCDTDPFESPTIVHKYQCSHAVPDVKVPADRYGYCLNVQLDIDPERREEFLKVIAQNQHGSRTKEPHCLQYDVGESVDRPGIFHFHEEYTSKEGLVEHNASPHFAIWEKFAASEPFRTAPVIEIFSTMLK